MVITAELEDFTERARLAIELARIEKDEQDHKLIYPEHILIGLMSAGSGIGGTVLREFGITANRARKLYEKIICDPALGKHVAFRDFAMQSSILFTHATYEAKKLGQDTVGTEHLLLALTRELFLEELGLDREKIRARVLEYLGEDAMLSDPRSLYEKTLLLAVIDPALEREVLVTAEVTSFRHREDFFELSLFLPHVRRDPRPVIREFYTGFLKGREITLFVEERKSGPSRQISARVEQII